MFLYLVRKLFFFAFNFIFINKVECSEQFITSFVTVFRYFFFNFLQATTMINGDSLEPNFLTLKQRPRKIPFYSIFVTKST